jgi:putative transposase
MPDEPLPRLEGDAQSDAAWHRARRRAVALEAILAAEGPRSAAVAAAARELAISTRQVYALLRRYELARTLGSLLRRTGARGSRITPAVEQIIRAWLKRYLRRERKSLRAIVNCIRDDASAAGERPPGINTVQRCLRRWYTDEEIVKRRHGPRGHANRLHPRAGTIDATYPLERTQIDSTPTNILLVDAEGVVIGRATLVILVDVFSHAVLGFCLSLEKPSAITTALCIQHAILPKEQWLAERNVPYDWPMSGVPHEIFPDRGREFRNNALARGCDDLLIRLETERRGNPHIRGIVERVLDIINELTSREPGTMTRSPTERGGYRADLHACLTFERLERIVAIAIAGIHNVEQDERSLRIPLEDWKAGIDRTVQRPCDPDTVLLRFLPGEERKLGPTGIRRFGLDYYSHVLDPYIVNADRHGKLLVRHDPRNISRIYVRLPDTGAYLAVGRRDGIAGPVSLWEHRAERRRRRLHGAAYSGVRARARRDIDASAREAATLTSRRRRAARAAERERLGTSAPTPLPDPEPAPRPKLNLRKKRAFAINEPWESGE